MLYYSYSSAFYHTGCAERVQTGNELHSSYADVITTQMALPGKQNPFLLPMLSSQLAEERGIPSLPMLRGLSRLLEWHRRQDLEEPFKILSCKSWE